MIQRCRGSRRGSHTWWWHAICDPALLDLNAHRLPSGPGSPWREHGVSRIHTESCCRLRIRTRKKGHRYLIFIYLFGDPLPPKQHLSWFLDSSIKAGITNSPGVNLESCLLPTPVTPTLALTTPSRGPPSCSLCVGGGDGCLDSSLGTCVGWFFSRITTVVTMGQRDELTSSLSLAHLVPEALRHLED